jgi:hypothetical protein
MCRTTNLVFAQKGKLDLTNEYIAKAMTGDGVPVSGEAVQKYFSGSSGVPLDNLGAFLRTLGLKVVAADMPEVSTQEYQALKMLAGKYLTAGDDQD